MLEVRRRLLVYALLVLVLTAGGVLAADAVSDWLTPDPPAPGDGTPSTDELGNWTTVTVLDRNGTALGTVHVRVADTVGERYTGLSNTDSLGPNEGMLFVHDAEGEYAYVMRDMAFPIDIVYVDSNRTITAIHHAETESRPYTEYRGTGQYVLEVPYEWTTEHGVAVGDRLRIEEPPA